MIRAVRPNLHGVFSRDLNPIAWVDSGDIVELETLDAWWGSEPFTAEYAPRNLVDHDRALEGHALTGPIGVRGLRGSPPRNSAPPVVPPLVAIHPGATTASDRTHGDVLEIEFLELTPGTYGFTECGGFPTNHYRRLACDTGGPRMILWELDPSRTTYTARNVPGLQVKAAPFIGVVGLAPAAPGPHSTTPPRPTGGNLDCSLLTAGSKLLLPVEVDGGLLSVGDGHGAQGDGEISNNGIECPMHRVRLRLTRRTDLSITGPVILRPDCTAILGLGPTLDAAMYDAANRMLDWLVSELRIARVEALGLMSACVDLRITQVVNGTRGVHAVWRRG